MKDYEGKVCIEVKNVKGKYIVFDKKTFKKAYDDYIGNGIIKQQQ